MNKTSVLNQINILTARRPHSFAMPGHKRNFEMCPFLEKLGADIDITEVDGADNLMQACGMLKTVESCLAKLFSSKATFMLVNGATAGILASIGAVACRGDKILIASNCHKSVHSAVELFGLESVQIMPEYDKESMTFMGVDPAKVEKYFEQIGEIKAIVLTSPTYDGMISDIQSIADIALRYGALLVVDEAHGSHLSFDKSSNKSAVQLGGDIVVNSLHKTLPSLTQTAVVHIASDRVDKAKLKRQINIFQSSSPSYILMSSIDGCAQFLSDSDKYFLDFKVNLDNFYSRCCADGKKVFKHVHVHTFADSGILSHDRSKILISADGKISGEQIKHELMEYGIEVEMSDIVKVTLLSSVCNRKCDFDVLYQSLEKIDRMIDQLDSNTIESNMQKNNKIAQQMFEVVKNNGLSADCVRCVKFDTTTVAIKMAVGKRSANTICAYPPGVPIVCAGQVLTKQHIDLLEELLANGINIVGIEDKCNILIEKNDSALSPK